MLSDHPHVKLVLESIRKYRIGKIDLDGLAENLSAVLPAVEGDLPHDVRKCLKKVEATVEHTRFAVNKDRHAKELDPVFTELEHLVADYDR
jgi:hypothetical protein